MEPHNRKSAHTRPPPFGFLTKNQLLTMAMSYCIYYLCYSMIVTLEDHDYRGLRGQVKRAVRGGLFAGQGTYSNV
jgi:hypothetical protein